MIIVGPSGSGKTNTLLHMIYYLLYFDEILIFANNLHQDKYQFLLNDFATRINPEMGYKVIQTPPQIIPFYDAFNDNETQKLVIFDDFVCDQNQDARFKIKVPKNIRDTSSHFCVFRFLLKENKRIVDDLGVDTVNLDKATKEPFSFLFYDKPRKKELKNFDEPI